MLNKVIGAAGQARMGKDELSNYLATIFPWKRIAFAKEVKAVFANTFDVDFDFIEKWKINPDPPPGFNLNLRKAMQYIGDGFRQIHSDIWIELCFKRNSLPLILSDCRYINELCYIHQMGGYNVLIYREEALNDDPNGSEAQIRPLLEYFDKWYEDGPVNSVIGNTCVREARMAIAPSGAEFVNFFIRNNGTLDQLYAKIDKILVPVLKERYNENRC